MPMRVASTGPSFDPADLPELGTGGEARVVALPGRPARVAKLYHHPDEERRAKVEAMMARPPAVGASDGFAFAWPADAVRDGAGAFAGFAMPRARGRRVFELYNPATRRERAPRFHTGTLHRVARNVAAAFAALHAAGYVVGDVNESNVVVGPDGAVTLVDCDSFQVREPGGALHRSRVGRAEFTPPELQGADFAAVERTAEHDRFGLAVLLFHLLMEGTHPFAGQYPDGAEPPPMEARIRDGHFAHAGRPDAPSRPPRLAPPFGVLHPELQALFLRCFAAGHADASERPPAEEWVNALEVAGAALVACEENARHRFGLHLGRCPWCERAAFLGGRDPFPAPGTAGRKERRAALEEDVGLSVLPVLPGIPGYTAPARVPSFGAGAWTAAPASGRAAATRPASAVARPSPARVAPPAAGRSLDWIYPRGLASWVSPFLLAMTYDSAGTDGWILMAVPLGLLATLTLIGAHGAPPGWERRRSYLAGLAGIVLLLMGVVEALRATDLPTLARAAPVAAVPVAPVAPAAPAAVPEAPVHRPEAVQEVPRLRNGPELRVLLSRLYPPALRDAGTEGKVMVRFVIDAQGRVEPASVAVAEASHAPFADAAREAVRAMRFSPARLDGEPVRVHALMPITFQTPW